jgi:mannose-6-phosphate isomerase-like protein (cupin superfamily)
MDERLVPIAERLRGMRDVIGVGTAEMACATGVSEEEYVACEEGRRDFTFTFLYKAAAHFGIDLTELLTGESPHLTSYAVVRKGEGLPLQRRTGFTYGSLAHRFRHRRAEPMLVRAPATADGATAEIILSRHEGQEFDYVLEGRLRVRIGDHEEVLAPGDSIYYDSGRGHGMVALDGDCTFLAVVMERRGEDGNDA